jgi:hypothetical protein
LSKESQVVFEQIWINHNGFPEVNLIAVKLVLEEALVYLL